MKVAVLDKGEKLGLVAKSSGKNSKNNGRVFISERNRRAREYNSDPERRKIKAERQRKYYEKMKTEHPEKFEKLRERHREYLKEYMKTYRGRK